MCIDTNQSKSVEICFKMGSGYTNLIVFVPRMLPTCAQCLFRGFKPHQEKKTYALVLLTGRGGFGELWEGEMKKAKQPQCLAPMYTHCMDCGHACWVARNENPVRALEEHLIDGPEWNRMWSNVRELKA